MYDFDIYHDGFGECPPEHIEPHLDWCHENINGYWYVEMPRERWIDSGREIILHYTFCFKKESDALAFKLRWL